MCLPTSYDSKPFLFLTGERKRHTGILRRKVGISVCFVIHLGYHVSSYTISFINMSILVSFHIVMIMTLPHAWCAYAVVSLPNVLMHSRMEVSASSISEYDERKALNILLDAFGSTFSIQEIASAYCEAGRNADLAGEILHDMNQSTSSFTAHASNQATPMFNEEVKDDDGNPKAAKRKGRPVSVGTISGVIGKSYARGTASANEFCMATKPLKLDVTNFPLLKCRVKEDNFDSTKDDLMHKEIEDFIFKMLGHGFQLDRGLIREVLGKLLIMPLLCKILLFF